MPWGMLPKLRPGTRFVDGAIAGQLAEATLSVEITQAPTIVPWRDATRDEGGWFRHASLQDEYCLVYDFHDGQLVVPCLQILRAFHAQTRIIAHAILRPVVLGELATGELHDHEARITIQRLVPDGVVTRSFARYLARLLFEPAWLTSFSDVFHTRFADSQRLGVELQDRIPLVCIPPAAGRSHWHLAGQWIAGNRVFLTDLISTRSNVQPPFRTLVVVHNKKGPKEKTTTSGGFATAKGEDRGADSDERGNDDPKNLTRPSLIRLRAVEHGDAGTERILDIYPGRRQSGQGRTDSGGSSENTPPTALPGPESFDDERRRGGRTSAEFSMVPGRDSMPSHFEVFIQAFADAVQSRDGWVLEFRVQALADFLPRCQPTDRLLLIGRLTTPSTVGHILELEPLSGQASYTWAVTRRDSPETADMREIGSRLSTWLTALGRSDVPELIKDDPVYRVSLSTHRDLGRATWANRILDKLDPPQRRPGWMRGQAS